MPNRHFRRLLRFAANDGAFELEREVFAVLVENPLGCQGVKRLCVEERAVQIKNERAGGKKGHVQESSLVSVG